MNAIIFSDLTTDEALQKIESESLKYEGLYVDMDDKNQRKFVKDSADEINSLLKKLERARIDKSKEYKTQVEAEANRIKERLELANKPLTLLIDAHKEKRAAILAEKKRIEDERLLLIQIEEDHESAITLDKIRTFEINEAIQKQRDRDEEIARQARSKAEKEAIEAEERAEQAEKNLILAQAQAKRDEAGRIEREKIEAEERAEQAEINAKLQAEEAAENARLTEIKRQADEKAEAEAAKAKLEANKKHVAKICGQSKVDLMEVLGVDEKLAVSIVQAIAKKLIANLSINY